MSITIIKEQEKKKRQYKKKFTVLLLCLYGSTWILWVCWALAVLLTLAIATWNFNFQGMQAVTNHADVKRFLETWFCSMISNSKNNEYRGLRLIADAECWLEYKQENKTNCESGNVEFSATQFAPGGKSLNVGWMYVSLLNNRIQCS